VRDLVRDDLLVLARPGEQRRADVAERLAFAEGPPGNSTTAYFSSA
jgi:hypothetical protein